MHFKQDPFLYFGNVFNGVKQMLAQHSRRATALLVACIWCVPFALLSSSIAAHASTYYLAPASLGGNDSNSGLSASTPLLSPNHSVSCGTVILAVPSSAYSSTNFNTGHWGTVSCSGGNNVAWLQCETFDACKIQSTSEGIYVDKSYWGVQGWEVSVSSGNGFCFGAAPNYSNPTEVHHIIFANNVANGCQAGGFSTFNINSTGVDYVEIIGNIAYNTIQGGTECYSAISIFQPVESDSNSGTHIFVAGNFAWKNSQPNECGGVQAWGGDAIIFDTFDGSQSGLTPYTAQAVADNNIVIGNGGHGIEIQNNVAGSTHAPLYLRHNTSWGNEINTNQQKNSLCAEILINSGYQIQEEYNLAAAKAEDECASGSNSMYALSAYTVNGSVWVYNNFAYGYNGQNTFVYNGGTFQYATNNILGENPDFANASTPGAPSCGGTGSVPGCMQSVVAGFTSNNSAAAGTGYQKPSSTAAYDQLFPQWVCSVTLPAGLVSNGC